MKNKGIIQNIHNNLITIEVFKDENCAHCDSCNKKIQTVHTFYCNDNTLSKGDIVSFYMEDSYVLKIGFYIYILPILSMILFYFITLFLNLNEGLRILFSFGGLTISFLFLFLWDKLQGKKILNNIKITKEKI